MTFTRTAEPAMYSASELHAAYADALASKEGRSFCKTFFLQGHFFGKWCKTTTFQKAFSRTANKYFVFVPATLLPDITADLLAKGASVLPKGQVIDPVALMAAVLASLGNGSENPDPTTFEPVVFASPEEVKSCLGDLGVKNAQKKLEADIKLYQVDITRATSLLPSHLFVCIDIEAYERDQSILTEIGWCIFEPLNGTLTTKHRIIQEFIDIRNGQYVADHKFGFLHGDSVIMGLDAALEELREDLIESQPCALVGHDVNSDLDYLDVVGLDLLEYVTNTFDTRSMFIAKFLKPQVSLTKMCDALGISTKNLHNAGNDAFHTMEAFVQMIDNSPPV
ncbi:hypothetical protein HKX48_006321 [Thoreauomyces humboldtii]|nr:hypothetical protein HKX48_006321 [Thoreauomyces humboldtii]